VVWENVPGVLSDKTGAFGAFLGGLGQLGYGFAYRVLDAQFLGVAQRRRRVFVVANLTDWRRAAAVLFESHSLSGDSPPSRSARKGTSTGFETGPSGSAEPVFLDRAMFNQGANAQFNPVVRQDGLSDALVARGPHAIAARMVAFGEYATAATASTCKQRDYKDITTQYGEIAGTLTARHDSSPCADQGQNVVAFPIDLQNCTEGHASGGKGFQEEHAYTLNTVAAPAVAFAQNSRDEIRLEGGDGQRTGALSTGGGKPGQGTPMIATNYAVRRLTPTECERLQGFPDDHTLIPFRGKPAADGPRYKAIGNSMAVPVMHWLGKRIQLITQAIYA